MAAREMFARYPGTCRACRGAIVRGERMVYDRDQPKRARALHTMCATGVEYEPLDSDDLGPRSGDDLGPVIEVRTASGTFTQRAGGRCEDAPCCGCCTF